MPDEAARDMHIHFDPKVVIVSAQVETPAAREELLRSARQMAQGRKVIDDIQVGEKPEPASALG